MKTSERHQLKTNEVADVIGDLTQRIDAHRRQILGGIALVVAVAAMGGGYWTWRAQRAERAATALSDAMAIASAPIVPSPPPAAPGQPAPPPPPAGSYPTAEARTSAALVRFREVASAYGSTDSGLAARYQAAALLADGGKTAEAEQEYRAVIERAGDGIYGQMASLGLAEVQVQNGQFEPAIATFKEMAARAGTDLPEDGLLMQLGRAYAMAGRRTDAVQTYQRILDQHPESLYATEARRELETLKAPAASAS
jgi:TolA-binding protein